MKRVQEALAGIIQSYADVYRPIRRDQSPPDQYVVYVTQTTEDEHWDDEVRSTKTFVYMNMWSAGDPTEKAREIRRAMRAAGFAMSEESTGSSSGTDYAEGPKLHCVSWTWICRDVVENGD